MTTQTKTPMIHASYYRYRYSALCEKEKTGNDASTQLPFLVDCPECLSIMEDRKARGKPMIRRGQNIAQL